MTCLSDPAKIFDAHDVHNNRGCSCGRTAPLDEKIRAPRENACTPALLGKNLDCFPGRGDANILESLHGEEPTLDASTDAASFAAEPRAPALLSFLPRRTRSSDAGSSVMRFPVAL